MGFEQSPTARFGQNTGQTEEHSLFHPAPKARPNPSPGQRPGKQTPDNIQALKGRHNICHNPLRACISTSFSAPRTESGFCAIPFAHPSTHTWPRFFKTWAARHNSSIPWKTTPIFFLICRAPWPSVRWLKTSKNRHQSGSKRRDRNTPVLRGKEDTGPLPLANPTCRPFANTSPTSANIIVSKRFRKNTGRFWNAIESPLTNVTFGIRTPLQGFEMLFVRQPRALALPRALPWAVLGCPFGADGPAPKMRFGQNPGQTGGHPSFHLTPRTRCNPSPEQTVRPVSPYEAPTAGPSHSPSTGRHPAFHTAPKARPNPSPGQRPGKSAHNTERALKGRPNSAANTIPIDPMIKRLTAELNAQFAKSAKLEKAIRQNLKGLGYGL